MHLERIQLTQFRSYSTLDLVLPEDGLILTGPNAAGKSSLLEAVRMLSILRSPRAVHDREVIHWSSGADLDVQPYARLVGYLRIAGERSVVELGLQRNDDQAGTLRKQIKVNGQTRRVLESVGTVRSVLFTPDDLDLVTGSPTGRRRFMDQMIGQIDRSYVSELSRYARVVEQRNSLLKSFTKGRTSRSSAIEQLGFWDDQLAAHGSYISAARRMTVGNVGAALKKRADRFVSSADLTAKYAPSLGGDFLAAAQEGDPGEQILAVARREFDQQIRMRRDEELRRGVTLIGPHRDDLELLIDGRSLAAYGSRGQQRLGVVSLKLAEADVVGGKGEKPILLLDDVLSELDRSHRSLLLKTVREFGAQIFITSADPGQVDEPSLTDLAHGEVRPGQIVLA
ncbi:MAG: DNA replication/repair protein RecF [Chloroflexota bacterium]|nr:DNA replication/repair protein RecF [Chloroflexota bacterium]